MQRKGAKGREGYAENGDMQRRGREG